MWGGAQRKLPWVAAGGTCLPAPKPTSLARTSPVLRGRPLIQALSLDRWALPWEGPSLGGGSEGPLEVRRERELGVLRETCLLSSCSLSVLHVPPPPWMTIFSIGGLHGSGSLECKGREGYPGANVIQSSVPLCFDHEKAQWVKEPCCHTLDWTEGKSEAGYYSSCVCGCERMCKVAT